MTETYKKVQASIENVFLGETDVRGVEILIEEKDLKFLLEKVGKKMIRIEGMEFELKKIEQRA